MDEPRVNWERYGDVKNDTGFRAETLTYIYSFKVLWRRHANTRSSFTI